MVLVNSLIVVIIISFPFTNIPVFIIQNIYLIPIKINFIQKYFSRDLPINLFTFNY